MFHGLLLAKLLQRDIIFEIRLLMVTLNLTVDFQTATDALMNIYKTGYVALSAGLGGTLYQYAENIPTIVACSSIMVVLVSRAFEEWS